MNILSAFCRCPRSMAGKTGAGDFTLQRSESLFYRILNLFSPVRFENNSSDFFAVSRQAADVLRQDYRERVRYLRGYVQNIGFSRTTISFEAPARAAGKSKYSLMKLIRFSLDTLCSFSDLLIHSTTTYV